MKNCRDCKHRGFDMDGSFCAHPHVLKDHSWGLALHNPIPHCPNPDKPLFESKEPKKRKVYVASSWRNNIQPDVVKRLRELGHEVYDFKNPRPGDDGFHWSEVDPNWENWTNEEYVNALKHPIAEAGFKSDFDAMKWADTFVLVLPCGRSAHLELGWAAGQGKETFVLLQEMEPELMVKMCNHVCTDMNDLEEKL